MWNPMDKVSGRWPLAKKGEVQTFKQWKTKPQPQTRPLTMAAGCPWYKNVAQIQFNKQLDKKYVYCNDETGTIEESKIAIVAHHPTIHHHQATRWPAYFPTISCHKETDCRISCIYPKASVHICNGVNPFRIITCSGNQVPMWQSHKIH